MTDFWPEIPKPTLIWQALSSQFCGADFSVDIIIKRLTLKDKTFRSICEDYALAWVTLAKFKKLPDAQNRPEVADYQVLTADLEKEIADYLLSARKLLRP